MATIKLNRKEIFIIQTLSGLDKQSFAETAGYSFGYFSRAINGGSVPFRLSERICKTYGLDDDFILRIRSLAERYNELYRGTGKEVKTR